MMDFNTVGIAHSPFGTPGAPPFQSLFSRVEETPIFDIKPYVPMFDSIPGAISSWVSATHIEQIWETSIQAQQKTIKNTPGGIAAG